MTKTIATKILLFIALFTFSVTSFGQKLVRFALFNNSDKEVKVVTSPIIQFKEFTDIIDTSLKVPKRQGDTGTLKLNGIFYKITRLDMKVLQHDANHPDTGVYILQPKSALIIGYALSKTKKLTLNDIFVNYLKFYTQTDTVIAMNKEEVWQLKDRQEFKWQNNSTIFSPRKPLFTYSIYIH